MIEATFRVSEVDSFRHWLHDEEAELQDLLARMRGTSEPSEAMAAGTAFHKALETCPADFTADMLRANGYAFYFLGDFEVALPRIREVRASKVYEGPDYRITVTGQVDTIHGRRVEDHKTTSRFDPERYLDGYQWRFYLDIFGADHFRWNVFEIAERDTPLDWEVRSLHRLEQFRYPAMHDDCARLVARLADFTRTNLPERIRDTAVAAA